MLREELEIRNKEREYDLRSIHAAEKQQQESVKKIAALEAVSEAADHGSEASARSCSVGENER